MIVGACEIDLRISGKPASLKEKRMVIQSLKDKIRKRFQVSVAEVDGHELWQRCVLGVACACGEKGEAENLIQKILRFVDESGEIEMLDSRVNYY